MSGNILARETLNMLLDYPERIYPEPEDPDPKKAAANKKKAEKEKKKKRKKKEPAFNTPDWALEIEAVILKVKSMEQLAGDKVTLQLDEDFIKKVNEQLSRFKKEISFRKAQIEEARIEAELKALKKKKKKK